jgi:hypothetical protein
MHVFRSSPIKVLSKGSNDAGFPSCRTLSCMMCSATYISGRDGEDYKPSNDKTHMGVTAGSWINLLYFDQQINMHRTGSEKR